MNEEKVKIYKRILALAIDFLIVTLISSFIIFVLPHNEKYQTASDNNTLLLTMRTKGQISNEDYLEESTKLTYDIYKYGKLENGITITLMVLYFGLFIYFNHGQTPGKKLTKIEVRDKNGNEVSLWSSVVRTIFVTRVFADIVTIILVYSTRKATFVKLYSYFDMGVTVLWLLCPFVAMFREDGRGLHDLIAGTKVLDKRKLPLEEERIVEAKIEEKKEKPKNNKKK